MAEYVIDTPSSVETELPDYSAEDNHSLLPRQNTYRDVPTIDLRSDPRREAAEQYMHGALARVMECTDISIRGTRIRGKACDELLHTSVGPAISPSRLTSPAYWTKGCGAAAAEPSQGPGEGCMRTKSESCYENWHTGQESMPNSSGGEGQWQRPAILTGRHPTLRLGVLAPARSPAGRSHERIRRSLGLLFCAIPLGRWPYHGWRAATGKRQEDVGYPKSLRPPQCRLMLMPTNNDSAIIHYTQQSTNLARAGPKSGERLETDGKQPSHQSLEARVVTQAQASRELKQLTLSNASTSRAKLWAWHNARQRFEVKPHTRITPTRRRCLHPLFGILLSHQVMPQSQFQLGAKTSLEKGSKSCIGSGRDVVSWQMDDGATIECRTWDVPRPAHPHTT